MGGDLMARRSTPRKKAFTPLMVSEPFACIIREQYVIYMQMCQGGVAETKTIRTTIFFDGQVSKAEIESHSWHPADTVRNVLQWTETPDKSPLLDKARLALPKVEHARIARMRIIK
jgi:hypothetical protein